MQNSRRTCLKPHKIRYYLERRDPEFEEKMAHVLCIYREVEILKEANGKQPSEAVAIISYDEKPGMQAIGSTAPDLPPKPGVHAAFARDHEYKRHGTLSLLAGIDLVTGKAHALVKDRHRSCEFIEFLQLLDSAYPASTAIKIILDNHSAHTSKETKAWLATQPEGPLRIYFHPQGWFLAQSRRGLLLQAGALRAPTHPSRFQTRACGSRLGRHRGRQPAARRPYLVLQTRKRCLI
jgi:transposase